GYRAAGQSLSSLIPSGKLGGEPLRTLLLARGGATGAQAIASVAVDRTLEMGGAAAFACAYALVLLRHGVPALEGALVTVLLGAAALALGVTVTVRRLRRGAGLVTAIARSSGLTRLAFVRQQMDVLGAAEEEAPRLVAPRRRVARAFALGLLANLLVLGEYALLLAAFGLPSGPFAVVAAVFATGAAHSLPVPAAVGALEGAELWLFGMLGHPPEVGLAVGLAVRLREVAWIVPGALYLIMRAPGPTPGALTTPPGPGVAGSRRTSGKVARSWKGSSAPTGSPRRGRRASPITSQPPGTSAARASARTASRSRARWNTFTPHTSRTLPGGTPWAAHGWFRSRAAKASGTPGRTARSVRSVRRRKSATGSVTR